MSGEVSKFAVEDAGRATPGVEQAARAGGHPQIPGPLCRPIHFGPGGALFGLYHPAAAPERSGAIVLCYPLGEEYMCSYRAHRCLAERLAAAGFPVLRFDYHGTGDSSGNDRDPERVRAWLDSVAAAIDEARALSGASGVSLFGARLGGTLAATAAAEHGGVDSLILWGSCHKGRAYVREIQAHRLLNADQATQGPKVEGQEEAAGFMLSASTVAALSKLDLLKAKPAAPRYLLIARDDLPKEEPLVQHLLGAGVDVSHQQLPGYQAMMVAPHNSVAPEAVIDAVVAFLSEVHPPRQGELDRAPQGAPRSSSALVRAAEGARPVREEAIHFGDQRRLFGVVTEPEAGGAAAKRTGVVFLNTGSNHHVGPNRMYVPLMRALAERGFASLRFDIEGIAESSPRPGARNNDVYTTLAVSNVEAAMAELRARRGVDRIFLVGLCSGAYHAFHTGLHDRSVTGAILINPQTFSWKEGDALDVQRWENYNSSRYYQRRLYNPEVWKKALRLEIDRRHVFDMVRTMSERGAVVVKQKAAALLSRIRGDARGEANLVASFKTILDRGTQVFLVYCKDDAGIDYLDQHVGERRLSSMRKKYPHFRMDIIDGPDHTFTPIWSQERLAEILTAYLTERRG